MNKKLLKVLVLVLVLAVSLFGCAKKVEPTQVEPTQAEATEAATEAVPAEKPSVGFVMIGLGNEFFESLNKEFVARFTDLGYEVDVANGEFNPQIQITAVENFIAMKKDVIVLWAVSPEPLNNVAKQAMDAGIKVVAFVQPLENYDACLLVDDKAFAEAQALIAANWVDKKFPDAADKSVPVVLLTRDSMDNTKEQGDVLRNIESYNSKFKLVSTVDIDKETVEAGMTAAESLYTNNPEAKVFLTVNSSIALGINNYFTAMSSPVTDYSDMGIFTLNGGGEILESVKLSAEDKSPLRGTVMTGGVKMTVDDCVLAVEGVLDGSLSNKHNIYAAALVVFADTIDEFFKTGNVTSVTPETLK